jgi:hypothetical protein
VRVVGCAWEVVVVNVVSREAFAFKEGDQVQDPRTGLRAQVLAVIDDAQGTVFLLAVETSEGGVRRLRHPGHGLRRIASNE